MDNDKLHILEEQLDKIPDELPEGQTSWEAELLLEKEDIEYISSLIYEEVDRGSLERTTIIVRPSSKCVIAGITITILSGAAGGVITHYVVQGINRLFKRIKKRLKKRVVEEREG
ncbi:MAG: hypothetical protein ACRD8W_23175 [Nitrososphaeraceae archaeon]